VKNKILRLTHGFEYVIVIVLLISLIVVVSMATIGLLIMIGTTIVERVHAMDISEAKFTMPLLHDVFTGFLMILIGLELIKTIVMYLDDHVMHVEVVMSVAMIAIARHVIDMDLKSVEPLSLVGTGSVILALAVGYYYYRRAALPAELEKVDAE
jgi:uncharacterized membrane protein (DUF373 family)